MWKQTITALAVSLLIVACNFYTYSRGQSIQREISVRDCELTGVHIIDRDTVLVCQIIKRVGPEANEPKVSERRKGEHDL
jgi:hypothetical protein